MQPREWWTKMKRYSDEYFDYVRQRNKDRKAEDAELPEDPARNSNGIMGEVEE